MKKSLLESLKEYGESDFYPFHMPGHKRNPESGELAKFYKWDITEIDGFDNLHEPEGIILAAQKRAASLFGSEETYFLVNGSTSGILSAVSAVADRGKKLIIARNCHKAVYHAAFLNRLQTEYIYPSVLETFGLLNGISKEQVEDVLKKVAVEEKISYGQLNKVVAGIVITSPTYDGIISDVSGIVQLAHEFEIPVIVDQAHGAHFGFHPAFPVSSVLQGADFVIQSVHKTLPAPTQTAVLHCNGDLADRELLRKYLRIYQSSSPSYLLMAGIDSCMDMVEKDGKARLGELVSHRKKLWEQIKDLKYIKIYPSMAEKGKTADSHWEPGMAEPGRLVISVRNSNITGQQLYDELREQYHLQMEMCGVDYIVAILSMMDTWEGFERLQKALTEIDRVLEQQAKDTAKLMSVSENDHPRQIYPLYEALKAPCEEVDLEDAIERAVSDFVNLYPPGIPLLAPGECLDKKRYTVIKNYLENGYHVQGVMVDNTSKKIRIKIMKASV